MPLTYDIKWVDLAPHLAAAEQPAYMYPRPALHAGGQARVGTSDVARTGRFHVPKYALLSAATPAWAVTQGGDMVRIPVWAFRTTNRSEAAVWGLGIQVGIEAVAALAKAGVREPVTQVVLVLGGTVTDLAPDDAYRCYVGIALRTL